MPSRSRLCVFLVLALMGGSALAQAWPSRPIRLLVGYPPGGSGDFTTRIIGDELSKELGVSVVVENRPGAGGSLAADAVAKSPADGYTILNGNHPTITKALYPKLPYDGHKDLVPVCRVALGTSVLVVNNNLPVSNLREFIAHAKANPGKLFSAAAGFGSAPHLAGVAFETVAGVKFTTVQFKGGGPAAQSLLAGDTQVMFATSPTVMGFIRANRMRALAITQPAASPSIPGIPGAEEAGLPGYTSTFWFGLFVPTGTPQPIVDRLHAVAARSLARTEVKERIGSQGMDAAPSASPVAFAKDIDAEGPGWEKVIRDSGAKVE